MFSLNVYLCTKSNEKNLEPETQMVVSLRVRLGSKPRYSAGAASALAR